MFTTVVSASDAAPAADEFAGIGATVIPSSGGARISTVLTGGAADLSGEIHAQDLIIAVGEGDRPPKSVRGLSVREIVSLIRGAPGSEVQLTLIPANARFVKRKVVALRRAAVDRELAITKAEVGSPAPDFSMTRLADKKVVQLGDYRGKVVVLEFWATWCGPCQAPMAAMQGFAEANPAWGDRVALLSLSVDRDRSVLEKHLHDRQWDKTVNMWDSHGGDGVYKVNAIPTTFVIDPEGVVRVAGHPAVIDVEHEVNQILGIESEANETQPTIIELVPVLPAASQP